MTKFLSIWLAAVAVTATSAHAVTVTDTTQLNIGFTVSDADLLQTHLASTNSTGSFTREGAAGLPALIDGGFGTQGPQGGGGLAATADASNTLTYMLDGAFNLTSIATYAGWDSFRGGQSYMVSYATAASPTSFIALASVFNNAVLQGNVNTRAVITASDAGFLASNVVAVQFAFNGDLDAGFAGYREIDIFGTSAAGAVPEPVSWAMLIAGFGLVGATQRRRRLMTIAA